MTFDTEGLSIDKLYIDARDPAELGLLPNGRPTLVDAEQFCDLA